jgi:hypothetical protein
MHAPRKPHIEPALRVMRYLESSLGQGLFFPTQNNLSLWAFSDSDWGGCPASHRSTTSYCIFLGSALISRRTKRQKTISLSLAEADYRTMTETCCELSWLWLLLLDLKILRLKPTLFSCDNLTILHIAANSVLHERTRHVAMGWHFIRNKIPNDQLKQNTFFSKSNKIIYKEYILFNKIVFSLLLYLNNLE